MIETLKQPIPVLPIRNAVLFPGTAVPLKVGRAKSSRAVEAASRDSSNYILVVTQRQDHEKEARPEDLYRVGTLAKIERLRGSPEEGYNVLVRGVERVRLARVWENSEGAQQAVIIAEAESAPDLPHADSSTLQALLESMKKLGKEILDFLPADTSHLEQLVAGIQDIGFLTHLVAANLDLEVPQKQRLLENQGVKERALELLEIMQKFKEGLEVQSEIREKLSRKMGKLQREGLLREQLKAIREELGELNGEPEEKKVDDLREKIEKAGMPEDVKKVALDELKRFEQGGGASPESHVIRNYLDLLVALPWSRSSALSGAENIDLEKARKVLEDDHYGLEKIKARIIQHLAVMKLRKGTRGSILCLVGPPGVGKTSLGQSVARALGRKFVRVSLGGVRDDAEIRGHRRTYVGAMPGRVIQGMKRAGENDPVMLLDEVDKLARSFQGDPASALLEVLDPEQNQNFLDHYLDVAFDLSKVFFICTANSLETIPGPLLDRMEVIELSGYTTAEKFHIARNHLIPKQEKEHGLESGEKAQVVLSDEALMRMITHYTREAGVRELQRKIASVLRWSTEKVLSPSAELPIRIDAKELEEVLGPERFIQEAVERIAPPGVVTGLAWTPVGGDILLIEANAMPGAGKLTLTGQLGDVMKESAQIAVSLVRSRLAHLIPGFEHDKRDLHIHVPAGAIPKDGPSAGVTMTATVASLLLNRSVSPKLAMTGEVTLRGAVLPVGGIKEKVIAAHRAGIEKVILPKRNQKDLRDVPEEVRSQMKFEFVESVTEVLRIALGIESEVESPGLASRTVGVPPSQSPAMA